MKVDANIHAGVKYLEFSARPYYFDDPNRALTQWNQILLALAAYNVGPRPHDQAYVSRPDKQGYDPNIWFDNVELVAAK